MKIAARLLLIIIVISFSTGLFFIDKAARPRPLADAHARTATKCTDCHTPWQGVNVAACKKCHEFKKFYELRPALRFHRAGKYCLSCHTEHLGAHGDLSRMDHTLLNGRLLCSDCHLDPHQGLFGRACRQCHGLSTWRVRGYEHPGVGSQNCARCHRPPISHRDESIWQQLQRQHRAKTGETQGAPMQACWQCHVIHSWRHLRM